MPQVDLIRTQPPAFITNVYPGAFFNENVLYAPSGAGTLTSAVAAEDSLLLRVSKLSMAEMQHADPHKAHQLVLCIFKQVGRYRRYSRCSRCNRYSRCGRYSWCSVSSSRGLHH